MISTFLASELQRPHRPSASLHSSSWRWYVCKSFGKSKKKWDIIDGGDLAHSCSPLTFTPAHCPCLIHLKSKARLFCGTKPSACLRNSEIYRFCVSGRGRMNKISIALQEEGPNQWLFQIKMTFSSITVFYFPVKILVFPLKETGAYYQATCECLYFGLTRSFYNQA